jgi:hypothetical protein
MLRYALFTIRSAPVLLLGMNTVHNLWPWPVKNRKLLHNGAVVQSSVECIHVCRFHVLSLNQSVNDNVLVMTTLERRSTESKHKRAAYWFSETAYFRNGLFSDWTKKMACLLNRNGPANNVHTDCCCSNCCLAATWEKQRSEHCLSAQSECQQELLDRACQSPLWSNMFI